MQQFQMDTLLNFNRKAAVFFGTINNPMMLASFIICLTPFLLLHNKINIIPISLAVWMSGSSGAILSLATGVLFYLFFKIKRKTVYVVLVFLIMTIVLSCSYLDWKMHPDANFPTFSLLGQRGLIWQRSLSLANQHPLMGWGIGTYQVLFPVYSRDIAGGIIGNWSYEWTEGDWIAWRKTHNCLLQIVFEVGWTGLLLFLGFIGSLFLGLWRVRKTKPTVLTMTGLVILGTNMAVHFPSRMLQTVIIMVAYLAFCKHVAAQLCFKEGDHGIY